MVVLIVRIVDPLRPPIVDGDADGEVPAGNQNSIHFAQRIDRLTPFRGREAQGGEELRDGLVLVAPGGGHLELESRNGRVVARVIPSEPGDKYTPSVDRTFEAAAKHFGSELLAVVLTGMGDDGRRGVTLSNRDMNSYWPTQPRVGRQIRIAEQVKMFENFSGI